MARGLGNLEVNYALFERLSEAAREQMGKDLTAIGQEALKLQEALVPRKSGALASTLSIQLALGVLRVRAGMLNVTVRGKAVKKASSANDTFYGVIVEYGRSAGEKVVRRRNPSGTYSTMRARWTALRARPFVHVESSIEGRVDALRETFWNDTLAKAGAA